MGDAKTAMTLEVNGQRYSVPDNLPSNITLNTYIRDHLHLKGTKFMCLEGGCGACIVSVRSKHPHSGEELEYAVNSCLVPLFACRDCSITTVEGIGSKTQGYHNIQAHLAKGNGSQCGYCSVGMVMNMYSILKSKQDMTMTEIENSFGGSLCRCTGYRPILDTFKSYAKDAPKDLVNKCADIEDLLNTCHMKKKQCAKTGYCNGKKCGDDTEVISMKDVVSCTISLQDGGSWYHVYDKKEIFEILEMCGENDYILIGGNTAHGVYRNKNPISNFISLREVGQLHSVVEAGGTLVLGANNSLTATMELFYSKSKQHPDQFGYLKELADHIDLIANVPVRNTGTLAGNLMIKNKNKDFPSDIFLILETVGATIVIEDGMEQEYTLSALEFSRFDMTKKLITKIIMHPIDSQQYVCCTFKIMPRAQNAHAYVNAGFLFNVDKKNNFKVLTKPNIVFGGIRPEFIHASDTEQSIVGKELINSKTIEFVMTKLKAELKPDHIKPDASPEYRQGLACSLFYKFVLGLSPEKIIEKFRSGGQLLSRPLSSGHQEISTDEKMYPVSKPITKIEALVQCAGEAEYVNDVPTLPNEVHGAFILAKQGPADGFTLDTSELITMPGVVAVHTAKDIPGKNTILYPVGFGGETLEPIYADGKVECAGMPLGAVFATSHSLALQAAAKAKVTYHGAKKPVIDVRKVVESGDQSRLWLAAQKKADSVKDDVKHKIKGSFWFPTQYHFTMETQSCFSVPKEDGIDIYPASQCPTQIQDGIAEALNVPRNSVNISIRRCGGGYGAKLGKSGIVAVTCALAAHLLQRPVRMVMNLETNMECVGKRAPCLFKYETGVDDNGLIQYLILNYYQDDGCNKNDSVVTSTLHHMDSIYDMSAWTINGYGVKTDLPSQTWCRSPGSTEAIGAMETIMEHIAKELKKDPVDVKLVNKKEGDLPFPELIDEIKKTSDYNKRVEDIVIFNKENRWKKRGISLVPMAYPFSYFGNYYSTVSVFGADGTVAVTHGCVEIGQGLNTKVAQVCAYILGIPVEDISVKPTSSLTAPNTSPTGGSAGSECAAYATKKACEEIQKRLEPIRKSNPGASWKEIVSKALASQINLSSTYMFTPYDDVKNYFIYGVSVVEVELDILTGQHLVLRADLLEDTGVSLSPEVDLGQIEGAYVMGLGLYTCEELVYDENTAQMLTNRSWNYKIPGAKDIPVDFRVQMRKNAPNPVGVLKSKATGEPPLCMSIGIVIAIRRALESARVDAGLTDDYFLIEPPLTVEKIWLYSGTAIEQFQV